MLSFYTWDNVDEKVLLLELLYIFTLKEVKIDLFQFSFVNVAMVGKW